MKYFISFLIGCGSSAIVAYVFPRLIKPIYSFFNRLYFKYSKYAIDLSGKWNAKFKEPEANGNILETTEEITLTQKGSYIEGEGIIGGKYARRFKYSGYIIHNILNGTYQRIDEPKGSIIGMGSFQLKISSDIRSMDGKCMWLDKDTNKIETSDYEWKKI